MSSICLPCDWLAWHGASSFYSSKEVTFDVINQRFSIASNHVVTAYHTSKVH